MTQIAHAAATNTSQTGTPWMQLAPQEDTSSERRIRVDRRVRDDALPAGMNDRRQRADRRLPEVQYLEFDDLISLQ